MSDSPTGGAAAGIIDRVLRFIDRPWKAVTVVVLIVLLGCGFLLYDKRDELIEAWLTPDTPELKTSAIPAALDKLAAEIDADIVQIWGIDLSTNAQWFVGARRHDGERPVIPTPRRLPIIVSTSDVKGLIRVIEGQPTCVALTAQGSPLARRLADRGMKRACAVPIPPTAESFVGVIYLVWSTATDPDNEAVAVGVAREVARTLATH